MSYVVYHVGDLARDRVADPDLDRRAEDYLERGTPLGQPTRKHLFDDSPRGRGEGFLTQRRIFDGVYEYRLTPATALSGAGLKPVLRIKKELLT